MREPPPSGPQASLFPADELDRVPASVAPGVTLLRGYADTAPLQDAIRDIDAVAPFRHQTTPGGGRMSVAMTNCGSVGWVSDQRGYRYSGHDPESGQRWPSLPGMFRDLARSAAASAGFADFDPDCCLVNRYAVGAQMGIHRDLDEHDLGQPIVSVSIGLPAVFVWRGASRSDPVTPVALADGDVLVWGGLARAGFHGVRRLRAPTQSTPTPYRYNLTFRRAR